MECSTKAIEAIGGNNTVQEMGKVGLGGEAIRSVDDQIKMLREVRRADDVWNNELKSQERR